MKKLLSGSLSAFALPIHRDRALSAGAASFLSKPCAPAELLVEVRRLLDNADDDRPTPVRVSAKELR